MLMSLKFYGGELYPSGSFDANNKSQLQIAYLIQERNVLEERRTNVNPRELGTNQKRPGSHEVPKVHPSEKLIGPLLMEHPSIPPAPTPAGLSSAAWPQRLTPKFLCHDSVHVHNSSSSPQGPTIGAVCTCVCMCVRGCVYARMCPMRVDIQRGSAWHPLLPMVGGRFLPLNKILSMHGFSQ